MKKLVGIFLICFLLVGCAQTSPASQLEPSATDTLAPTSTISPKPSPSPLPFEGRLFFDMNGSGLHDQATFTYDTERLADERQPLQPDLQKAVVDYISNHPDLKDGDLVTIDEPGLSGFTLCTDNNVCTATNAEGRFVFSNEVSNAFLTITDPNAGIPALEMRYINQWKRAVTVKEYTKDVDTDLMATLTNVPGCQEDAATLVCKQDEDTLLVRDQHLNDTEIIPVSKSVQVWNKEEIGLMQGFLTLPFDKNQYPIQYIQGLFDIIGYRIFDDDGKYNFFNTQDGRVLAYNGVSIDREYWDTNLNLPGGVGDQHTGIDYLVPINNNIVSSAPTSSVWYLANGDENTNFEFRVNTWFEDPENSAYHFGNCYGHLSIFLVKVDQTIYRGQLIGLSGSSGYAAPYQRPPMLHFHLEQRIEIGWSYIDPYRYIPEIILHKFENGLPTDFWGNEVSMWTSDNLPLFY